MTIAEAIEKADALTPNGYTQNAKVEWLSRLDLTVYNEILKTHENMPLAFAKAWGVENWNDSTSYGLGAMVVYKGLLLESLKASNTVEPKDINWADPEWKPVEIDFEGYGDDVEINMTLLIPEPYCHIYLKWIETQINYQNGDYGRYNNSLQAFRDAYSDYRNWYNHNNMPLGRRLRFFR
jgi:hypothetical protein